MRALLGPASLPLLGAVRRQHGAADPDTVRAARLCRRALGRRVSRRRRAIRGRLEAIDAAGLSFSGHREVDAALFRKLSKAIWLAAAGVGVTSRLAAPAPTHLARQLLSAIGALDEDASVQYGDVQVSGRAANSLTCSLFDLYDVDNDGSLSFAEFSCGLITLSLLELGRGRCDEANALAATFAVLDVDGSGYLEAKSSSVVCSAAWVARCRRTRTATRTAFRGRRRVGGRGWLAADDDNDDGKISRTECAAGPKAQPGEVVARMLPELPG